MKIENLNGEENGDSSEGAGVGAPPRSAKKSLRIDIPSEGASIFTAKPVVLDDEIDRCVELALSVSHLRFRPFKHQ